MEKKKNIFTRFFGVILSSQTYINILYLFLAFPLGIIYLVFLVVGFSVGFALLIVLVGAAVLALVMAGWYGFANFERLLANQMLGESIPPFRQPESSSTKGLGETILAYLSNPITWKSLFYLFLKFPLGILVFAILALMFVLTGFFLTAIITFNFFELRIEITHNLVWQIDTFWKALLCLPIGFLIGIISLHICNWIAKILGHFASLMLSDQTEEDLLKKSSKNLPVSLETKHTQPVQTNPPLPEPTEYLEPLSQETIDEVSKAEDLPAISWDNQDDFSQEQKDKSA